MNDPNTEAQGTSVGQASNELAKTNKNFSLSRFPVEVKDEIWQYLSFRKRAWVHEPYWSENLWNDVLFIKPDIFRYSQPLKQTVQSIKMGSSNPNVDSQSLIKDWMMNELTKTKLSSIAISLFNAWTREEMISFKTFINLMPGMELQDLVISSRSGDCFDYFASELRAGKYVDLEDFPALLYLPEEDKLDVVEAIRVSREAKANRFRHTKNRQELKDMLEKVIWKMKEAQQLAQITSLANCSHLRSLILDADFNILRNISQKPISQCKLDIFSIQSDYYRSYSKLRDGNALRNMVKKAQVLDIIDCHSMIDRKLARDLVFAASSTLKYLTIDLDSRHKSKASVITFPKLEFLRLSLSDAGMPYKLNCPNLKILRLEGMLDIECFTNVSSVEMLLIEEILYEPSKYQWNLLKKAGSSKIHTLFVYDVIESSDFFALFLKETELPHLKKIVVLRSDPLSNVWFGDCEFEEFFRGKTQNIRKIDTLIWNTGWRRSFCSPSSELFVRTHLATNLKCINGKTQLDRSLDYSQETIGEFDENKFVVEKLADKYEIFQQYLERSSQN